MQLALLGLAFVLLLAVNAFYVLAEFAIVKVRPTRVAELEERFRALTGAPHAVAVASATAGMHLVLTALGVGPGDEVVTPSLTFASTVNQIALRGAAPVFDSVTVCDGTAVLALTLPKSSPVGATVSIGARPVPLSRTTVGLAGSLLPIDSPAVRNPPAVGWKLTLKVQLLPASSCVPQVLPLSRKSPGLAPVAVLDPRASTVAPVFVMVTV